MDIIDKIDDRYLPRDTQGNPVLNSVLLGTATVVAYSNIPAHEKIARLRQVMRLSLHDIESRKHYIREDLVDRMYYVLLDDKPYPKWVKYALLNSIIELHERPELNYSDLYVWLTLFLCDTELKLPNNLRVLRCIDDYITGSRLHPYVSPDKDIIGDVTKSMIYIHRITRFIVKDPNWGETDWVHEAFNCVAYMAWAIQGVMASRVHYDKDVNSYIASKILMMQKTLREAHRHVNVVERKERGSGNTSVGSSGS